MGASLADWQTLTLSFQAILRKMLKLGEASNVESSPQLCPLYHPENERMSPKKGSMFNGKLHLPTTIFLEDRGWLLNLAELK